MCALLQLVLELADLQILLLELELVLGPQVTILLVKLLHALSHLLLDLLHLHLFELQLLVLLRQLLQFALLMHALAVQVADLLLLVH